MKESYRINDFRGLEEEIKSKGRERKEMRAGLLITRGEGRTLEFNSKASEYNAKYFFGTGFINISIAFIKMHSKEKIMKNIFGCVFALYYSSDRDFFDYNFNFG